MTVRHRAARVLGTTLALVAGLAVAPTPAAATVPETLAGNSQLDIGGTIVDLSSSACTPPTPAIELNAASGSVSVIDLVARDRITVGFTDYIVDVMEVAAYGMAGTYTGANPTSIANVRLGLRLEFRAAGAGCTPSGTLLCRAAAAIKLTGTYTGDLTSPSGTDDLALAGRSMGNLVADPTCSSGPTSLIGDPVLATFVTGTLVGLAMGPISELVVGTKDVYLTSTDCGLSMPTAVLDVDSGSVEVVDLIAPRDRITVGGTDYLVDVTDVTASGYAGAYTGFYPTYITDLGLGVHLDIYAATTPCTSSGPPLCQAETVIDLDGGYNGDLEFPEPGYWLNVGGSDVTGGLQPDPSCTGGPFAVNTAVDGYIA